MEYLTHLNNCLLIAMPNLADPYFAQTVSLMCEHSGQGGLGININRPTSITLADVLSDMNITVEDPKTHDMPILFGGPVHQERGFVIHRPKGHWRSTVNTHSNIAVTTSRDILEAIAKGEGPDEYIVSLGYASWEPGQLEREIAENSWLYTSITDANADILFSVPFTERWLAAIHLLGINLTQLATDAGHA